MKKCFIAVMTFIMIIVCVYAMAEDRPKGESKVCDDIGYLSTQCLDVDVLPMEYKDKDVALEKAKQPITINDDDHITIVSGEKIDEKEINDIVVKYKWEED